MSGDKARRGQDSLTPWTAPCWKVLGQSAENLGFPVRFSIFTGRQEPEQGLKLRTVHYFLSFLLSLFLRYLYGARQFVF